MLFGNLFHFIMLNRFYLLEFLFAAEMELDKGQQKPTCDRKNRFATLILAVDLLNKSNPPVKFLLSKISLAWVFKELLLEYVNSLLCSAS